MKDYERMWKTLYKRIKAMEEIDSFHGLRFKTKTEITLKELIDLMEKIENEPLRSSDKSN